jgi:TonB family protein
LKAVLGANRNANLPEPFAEIVRGCLMPDPAARWNPARIEACLRGDPAPASQAPSRARWWVLAAAAAVVVALIAFWPSQAGNSNREAQDAALPAPKASAPPAEQRPATPGVITRVLPEIPQAARKTITGRVRVNVRVRVDGAGNVLQASLEPPRASKYLSERVLAAARAWKFPAGNPPQDWMLRFELMREQTRVSEAKQDNR